MTKKDEIEKKANLENMEKTPKKKLSEEGRLKRNKHARELYEADKEAILERRRELYNRSSGKSHIKYKAKYYLKNKADMNERQKLYHRGKYNTDIQFKIKNNLRSVMNAALRGIPWSKTMTFITGSTTAEYVKHIDSKLKPGMSWDNRSKWHIDHIKPVADFDLTNLAQLKQCYHYTNLTPLWKGENLRKATNRNN